MESPAYKNILPDPIERQNLILLELKRIPLVELQKMHSIFYKMELELRKNGETLGYTFQPTFLSGEPHSKELEEDILALAIQGFIDYKDVSDIKET